MIYTRPICIYTHRATLPARELEAPGTHHWNDWKLDILSHDISLFAYAPILLMECDTMQSPALRKAILPELIPTPLLEARCNPGDGTLTVSDSRTPKAQG